LFHSGTMIELPASMTHASIPVSERKKIGISDSLIKMSVRIEDVKDLINDIAQGLERM
jgi:cystathionine beta-lyase/cystathionine gamma-synthase